MYVIVVQHEGHVTRVIGQIASYARAASKADQLRKDNRGFEFTVHPVLARIPDGTSQHPGSIEAPSDNPKAQGEHQP